jgi:WhiB family redox-sensing transcriptional regulator
VLPEEVGMTDDDAEECRALYASGMLQKHLAARYGVTQHHISRIVNHVRRPAVEPTAVTDESWRSLARCSGLTASFFPDPKSAPSVRQRTTIEAQQLCSGCPVIKPCLDYALAHRIRDGVWGGLNELERDRLLRRRSRGAARAATGG